MPSITVLQLFLYTSWNPLGSPWASPSFTEVAARSRHWVLKAVADFRYMAASRENAAVSASFCAV